MTATVSNFTEPHFGNIPLACVVPSKTNPRKRFDEASLAELADSILRNGLAQPILVRPLPSTAGQIDRVEIVAGERRYRAAKIAGLDVIPAIVRELTDVQALELQIVENVQREDVHEIEEAEGYHRLMEEHGYTSDMLAEKVGKSRSYIYGRLKLCALVPLAREAFFEGKLNSSLALLIARIPVPELQEHATKEITTWNAGESMSYRRAVEHIQERYMLDLDRARFDIKDAKLLKAAGACTTCDKRTGSHPLLFPDVGADVCTDPNCFAAKGRAQNQKIIDVARKQGIPVIEGDEAADEFEAGDLATLDDQVREFERSTSGIGWNQTIENSLPKELLPKPVKYVVIDGKPEPLFEMTAMQAALEKAGLCETPEQQAQRLAEEQAADSGDTNAANQGKGGSNSISKQDKENQERKQRAENEEKFRTSVFLQAREALHGELPIAALRDAMKILLDEYSIPECLPKNAYPFKPNDDDGARKFIDQATWAQLELLLFDFTMSEVTCCQWWNVGPKEDMTTSSEHQIVLRLAELGNVDVDQIRAEIFPPEEKEAKPKGKKAKTPAVTKTVLNPEAAWPFPTGARP